MSNLTAEQRVDKNGKIVTRHIRQQSPLAQHSALSASRPSLGASKPKSYKKSLDQFDIHAPHSPDYVAPTSKEVKDGSGVTITGSKHGANMRMPLADIAKGIRNDFKEAIDSGYLPDLKYSVRIARASMMQSVSIEVDGIPNSELYGPSEPDQWGFMKRPLTDTAEVILERVELIADAYNSTNRPNDMDSHIHNTYWLSCGAMDDESRDMRAQQTAKKRRAREDKMLREN